MDRRPQVLIAEYIDPEGRDILERHADVAHHPECASDRQALLEAIRRLMAGSGLDALVVRNRVAVDAEVLRAAGGLRVVGRLGVGLDNVDLDACRTAGVRVVFARGANAEAVCEYVFAALLHLGRRLAAADAAVRAGGWPRQAFIGEELAGQTIGVVGLGEVGRRVAERAAAFGMTVLGADPYLSPEALAGGGIPVRLCAFDALLAAVDVLSLHVPLTPDTAHLLGADALGRLRPGAIIVNTSRGGIIDETALEVALRTGRLRGAALDVRAVEPPAQPDPLAALPGVLLTPHIAGWTRQALGSVGRMVAEGVLAVLRGERPPAEA